jgi:xanthine/uracil/vitamin C permease (AzgA family)
MQIPVLQGLSFVNRIKSRFHKQTPRLVNKHPRKLNTKQQTLSKLPFNPVSFAISESTFFSSAGWFVSLSNQVGFDHTSIEPFDQMASTTH